MLLHLMCLRMLTFSRPDARTSRRASSVAVVVMVIVSAVGCAGGAPFGGAGAHEGPRNAAAQPGTSVTRFLEAANTGDVESMARLFGNPSGTVAETVGGALGCAVRTVGVWLRISGPCIEWAEIEAQMATAAALLQHDSHRVRAPVQVQGRRVPAIRYDVDLVRGGDPPAQTVLVVVQDRKGRWVVESVALDGLTPRVR